MKINRFFLAVLLAFLVHGLPAQQATSWKNHPSIQQLKEGAIGIFPDMTPLKGMALGLLLVAVVIWFRYFWITWREMRSHSLRQKLRKLTPTDTRPATKRAGEPSAYSSPFPMKGRPSLPACGLKAASDTRSANGRGRNERNS